jgi:hypothetical protein
VNGLRDVASVFPNSQLISGGGSGHLIEPVSRVFESIAREDGGAPSQIAFVVDRSFSSPFGAALQIALAANREKAPAGSYALITCGHDGAIWSARVDVPLTAGVYSVLRASINVRWTTNDTAIEATWVGLAKATELPWRTDGHAPHLIVLTDDRPSPRNADLPAQTDPATRTRVKAWAQARNATLHVIRISPQPRPGLRSEGQEHPLMDVKTVAGLFRSERYMKASTAGELSNATEDALAAIDKNRGAIDLVVVDDQRDGLDGPKGVLSRLAAAFQRFCATPDHRVALVRWGQGTTPSVVFDFTTDSTKLVRAVSQSRRAQRRAGSDALFDALEQTRRLSWRRNARRALVVFTEAYLEPGKAPVDPILDWADTNDIAVTIIGP